MEKFSFNYHDEYSEPTEKEFRDSRSFEDLYISPDYNEAMERLVDPEIKKKVLREEQETERDNESWYGNIDIW